MIMNFIKNSLKIIAFALIIIGSQLMVIALSAHSAELPPAKWENALNELTTNIFKTKGIHVKLTAYNADPRQTDSTPTITASGKKVRHGYCALSRDLEAKYNLKFGDRIWVNGLGILRFEDRMHQRKRRQVDIFMWDYRNAIEFGIRHGKILLIKSRF
jgi:3D (Asp-Asp-Asp) domain-containing protein